MCSSKKEDVEEGMEGKRNLFVETLYWGKEAGAAGILLNIL